MAEQEAAGSPPETPDYPSVEILRQALQRRAEDFARLTGKTVKTVSRMACNGDGTFLPRVFDGGNFNANTYESIMKWFDEHWPKAEEPSKQE